MIHVHRLDGCAPTPLAHYLKALGILRLVSEQADHDARAWWNGNRFRLATKLNNQELDGFFLRDYEPTPLISPWNKGAGFFSREDPAIAPIEASTSPRFSAFRGGIEAARSKLAELSEADKEVRDVKAEAKRPGQSVVQRERIKATESYKSKLREAEKRFKQLKADLIPNFRLAWRGAHREWMDAAMVLQDDGTPKYPALLGTGGADGRLDFTNNYMKRIAQVFDLASDDGGPRTTTASWIAGALWGDTVDGSLWGQPVGQYLPGTAGGANNGNGPGARSLVNPMDFILMLEGTVVFTSSVSRRLGSTETSRATSPFTVNACGAAYESASPSDEGWRGEQWMPLWSRPSTHTELCHLLAEGRAQLGARSAREPLDLARAIQRLGTARGVKAFQRYGYIERNGQSNLAVPLGRFEVADRPSGHLACLDDLDWWLRRLRREARKPNAPKHLGAVEKRLADALFAVSAQPDDKGLWQVVLLRLAEVEQTMAKGSGFAAGPVPRLRPEWATACDDGTAEFRLALAFALQARDFRSDRTPVDPIRRHWLPLDMDGRFATTGKGSATRLNNPPGVVAHRQRGVADAIALVQRRLVEGAQRGERHLPLRAAPGTTAGMADIARLVTGDVDLDRTLALSRALMAVNRATWADNPITIETPTEEETDCPDDAWLAIRLCALPWPLATPSGFKLDLGTDPALVRLLAAGDSGAAFELAARRLGAAGVRCTVRVAATAPDAARLWAAALAFPVSQSTARRLLRRLDPNKE
ncbi:MAG: type I-U CRISPR-associated protein Csx17 [Gammaproteobacteria bacterium]|nr:type I-U CRISPR-associated protein Csx17 [Gammaproteobacteria bacterium]